MLLIDCPNCGARPEIEFRGGGESHIQRPGPHGDTTDEAWADYLFYRTTPKGDHAERWLHAAGCRQRFNLVRCTVSHHITSIYPMGKTLSDQNR